MYDFGLRVGVLVMLYSMCLSGCGKSKATGEEAEQKGASGKSKGLAPSEVLKLRDIEDADGLKRQLDEWGEYGRYSKGTAYVTLDHPLYREVFIDIDKETGVPMSQFNLQLHNSTTTEEVNSLADRLESIHRIFQRREKKVVDAMEGKFSYTFRSNGMNPFARLFHPTKDHWSLSICFLLYPSQPDACWGALELVLADQRPE